MALYSKRENAAVDLHCALKPPACQPGSQRQKSRRWTTTPSKAIEDDEASNLENIKALCDHRNKTLLLSMKTVTYGSSADESQM